MGHDGTVIEKKNGYFDMKDVYVAVCGLPDGRYLVQIKKYRNTRTNNQNAYLWGVVYPAVMQGFIDMGWDEITNVDMVHEIFKAKFLTTEAVNKHTGELISFPLSTAKMDTQQFTTYVDQITDFAREHLKIEIPTPDYNKH